MDPAQARPRLAEAAHQAGPVGRQGGADPQRLPDQPSAKGQLVLHVNTFTRKERYAYMLERYGPDTSKWPHIPGGRTPAQPGNPAASPEPAARKVPAACPALSPALACPSRLAAFHCPVCNGPVERYAVADSANQPRPARDAGSARNSPDEPPAHLRRRDHDRIRPCAPGRPARRRRALCGHHRGRQIMTRRPRASDWHQRSVTRGITALSPADMSCPRTGRTKWPMRSGC
jgi:hypothetical protein